MIGDLESFFNAWKLPTSESALTSAEIVEITGMCRGVVVQRLKEAIKAGMIKVTRKKQARIDGVSALTPAYTFVKKETPDGKKKRTRSNRKGSP